MSNFAATVVVVSLGGLLASGGYSLFMPSSDDESLNRPVTVIKSGVTSQSSGCAIKGNISVETGERIYHVPGQHYYDVTRISLRRGERWFCSEAEAQAAGWRKAAY